MERAPRVYRHTRKQGGILLGLCSGIAAHLGVDPVIIRLAFLLLTMTLTAGLAVIIVYLLFALFISYEPESGD